MGRSIVERLVARGHDVAVVHRRDHHDLGPRVRNLQADRGDLAAISALLKRERADIVFDLAYDCRQARPPATSRSPRGAAATGCSATCSCRASRRTGRDSSTGRAIPSRPRACRTRMSITRRQPSVRSSGCTRPPGFRLSPSALPTCTGRDSVRPGAVLLGPPARRPRDCPARWWRRTDAVAYVEDVAEACVRAIEVPEAVGQAFNVAHVEPMTQRTFVEALAGIARIEPTFVSVPRRAIAAAGGQLVGDRLYFGEYLDIPPHTSRREGTPVAWCQSDVLRDRAPRRVRLVHGTARRTRDYSFEDRLIAQA